MLSTSDVPDTIKEHDAGRLLSYGFTYMKAVGICDNIQSNFYGTPDRQNMVQNYDYGLYGRAYILSSTFL